MKLMIDFPTAAILLAAYNGREWIEEQLQSILNQKNVDVTIYVSVDLSSDNTHEFVQDMSRIHENIKVLPYGDRFGGAAPNFFRLIRDVDFSTYDYVALADQDDIWNVDKLSNAFKKLSTEDFDAYSSNVIAFWDSGKNKLINKAQQQREFDYLFESAGPGCTFVFTKEFSMKLNDKLLNIGEDIKSVWMHDWFIYSFSRSSGFKWFVDEKPSMNYRQHLSNQVGSNIGVTAYLKRIKLITNGDWFRKVLSQANTLNQEDLVPIKLLLLNNRYSYFRLAMLFLQCRRKPIEQYFFFLVCILVCIKGPIKYN
jgi:rhamnosyltransferase